MYELTVPGDVILIGGLDDDFVGCLRCALPNYGMNPLRYRSAGTCAIEYHWHLQPFRTPSPYPWGAHAFRGAYASPTHRYSPWNPRGEGLIVLQREEDGWTYYGILSVNPNVDRSWHPLARTVIETYERTGAINRTLVALCEAASKTND